MNNNRTTIPIFIMLAVAAIGGGWFYSSNYLLTENDTTGVGNDNAQFPMGGVPVPPPKFVWKTPTPAEKKAALSSIISQLEAFKKNDWAKAATYQSSALRNNFGSLSNFERVIKRRYPQFADYQKVDVIVAQSSGPRMHIALKLTGSDGIKVDAFYIMLKENGIYRVDSVGGRMAPRRERKEEEPANLI